MSFALKSFFRVLALSALAVPAPVLAQDSGGTFSLQLNLATDTPNGNCRLTYVARNQSEIALDRTAYEVAVFDADGAVTRLLVLEFGELIAGKTRVVQFDLPETECASIGEIVVNRAAACVQAGGGDSDFCMAGLDPSSRIDIAFGQ